MNNRSVLVPLSRNDVANGNASISQFIDSTKTPKKLSPLPKKFKAKNEKLIKMAAPKLKPLKPLNVDKEIKSKNNANPLKTKKTNVKDSTTTAKFSNFAGELECDGVEQTLLKHDYVPIDKILTRSEDGQVMCKFIKAKDKVGHSAYVELDSAEPGHEFVDISNGETVLTSQDHASVVPYSVKMGTYECANSDVCGVAFECDNEICTMQRNDDSMAPTESVFSYTTGMGDDQGILQNHPISYPIVKLTEIMENPKMVTDSIKTSHEKMRNVAFGQCMKEVEDMKCAALNLQQQIDRFDEIQTTTSNVLSTTINQLEEIHDMYEFRPPACDSEKRKLQTVRFNLSKRHDLTNNFLTYCQSVNQRISNMKQLTDDLNSLNSYAEKLFKGIESTLSE